MYWVLPETTQTANTAPQQTNKHAECKAPNAPLSPLTFAAISLDLPPFYAEKK
jgi:hypothetical protein